MLLHSALLCVSVGILCVVTACSHKQVKATRAIPPPPAADRNSYIDLTPGSRLRILVPLLKQGNREVTLGTAQSNGRTLTLSAKNLVGYQVSYYSAERQANGKVHLTFISAETTKDGLTVAELAPPRLPFPLPRKGQLIRLLFLIRVSDADHNMAIVAADNHNALEALTTKVRQDPLTCQITGNIFCVWVPEGIAVRPQPPAAPVR
jgi:hypothetical protein